MEERYEKVKKDLVSQGLDIDKIREIIIDTVKRYDNDPSADDADVQNGIIEALEFNLSTILQSKDKTV